HTLVTWERVRLIAVDRDKFVVTASPASGQSQSAERASCSPKNGGNGWMGCLPEPSTRCDNQLRHSPLRAIHGGQHLVLSFLAVKTAGFQRFFRYQDRRACFRIFCPAAFVGSLRTIFPG